MIVPLFAYFNITLYTKIVTPPHPAISRISGFERRTTGRHPE
jgi:hypothetical protein